VWKEQGVPLPTGSGIWEGAMAVPPPQGFVHFYCKKTTCLLVAGNQDQGGLIDPLGAEDVKCRGLKN